MIKSSNPAVRFKHTQRYKQTRPIKAMDTHVVIMILGAAVAFSIFIPLIIGYMMG